MNHVDFWSNHTWLFVFAMCFFPRLTMLLATTFGGGFWYWVGWFFAPRLTVAIIATMLYSQTNFTMVVLAWFWTFSGEFAEKATVSSSRR